MIHRKIRIVKLAPTRFLIHRLTTLTTSRSQLQFLPQSLRAFRRDASSKSKDDNHSPYLTKPQKEQGTTLPQLQSLLTNYNSVHQPATKPSQVPVKPRIRYYIDPTSDYPDDLNAHTQNRAQQRRYVDASSPETADRWHRRKTLGRPRAPERTPLKTGTGRDAAALTTTSEHILFEPPSNYLFRLQPFDYGGHPRYRRPDYVHANKMKSLAQILTVPTADTAGTTLLLQFDNKRYLFGSLSEGTQRACIQMGTRLAKVGEIFISGKAEWRNTGGLIGMVLSLADVTATSREAAAVRGGKGFVPGLGEEEIRRKVWALARGRNLLGPKGMLEEGVREELEEQVRRLAEGGLRVTGPEGLGYGLATARRFVFRKGLPVEVHEVGSGQGIEAVEAGEERRWEPYWADENLKVWALKIMPEGTEVGRPVNPRKRNSDEAFGESGGGENGGFPDDGMTQKQRDQLTVKAVIGDMFNSSWRLDSLTESLLSEVSLPATLFQRSTTTHKIEKYTGPLPGANPPPDPNTKVLVRKPWPGALVENLPPMQPSEEAISYIVRNHTQRGKFNPQAAMALKVPKGAKWSQLAAGSDVQNEHGETITSEQVLGESKEGGGVAVVDLPSEAYCEALVNRPEWRQPEIMTGVGAIVWNMGAGVAGNKYVKAFMEEFSQIQHIVSGVDVTPNTISLDSVAAATVRLRKVDPSRYSVPDHDNEEGAAFKEQQWPQNVQVAKRGQQIQLMPSFEVQDAFVRQPLDVAATEADVSAEVLAEAEKAQTAVKSSKAAREEWAATVPCPEAEIITLGTGSALPSKYRNVSATLLLLPGWGNVLFDCGENTLGQMKRVFSPEELKKVLQDLRIITISHMHADHHLGTVSVIKAWYQEVHSGVPAPAISNPQDLTATSIRDDPSTKRLSLISEPAMQHWLLEYSAIEDYGYSRLAPLYLSPSNPRRPGGPGSKLGWFIPPHTLSQIAQKHGKTAMLRQLDSHLVPAELIGLQDLQAVHVSHCRDARAVALTFPSSLSPETNYPFKVSYSGDCRPSPNFSAIGVNSTVCIHEATFDDELQGDADAKRHSTTSEALGVAQGMAARACVLTHFSQRYQKLPVLEYEGSGNSGGGEGVGVGGGEELVAEEAGMEMDGEEDGVMDVDDTLESEGGVALPEEAEAVPPTSNTTTPYLPPTAANTEALPSAAHPTPFPVNKGPQAVKFKLTTDMKVAVAFDYLRLRVGAIAEMEHFTPALLALLRAEDEMGEECEGKDGEEEGDEGGVEGGSGGKGKGKNGKGKGGGGAKGEGKGKGQGGNEKGGGGGKKGEGKGRRFN